MDSTFLQQQREALALLRRLIAERRQSEEAVQRSSSSRKAATQEQHETEQERLQQRADDNERALVRRHTEALADVTRQFEIVVERASAQHEQVTRQSEAEAQKRRSTFQSAHQQRAARAVQEYDLRVREAAGELQVFKTTLEERRESIRVERELNEKRLRRRRCRRHARNLSDPQVENSSLPPLERFEQEMAEAKRALAQYPKQRAARFLGSGGLFVVFIFTGIVATLLGAWLDLLGQPWLVASAAVTLAILAVIYVILRPIVVRQTLELYQRARGRLENAHAALDAARALAVAKADKKRADYQKQRDENIRQSEKQFAGEVQTSDVERQQLLKESAETLRQARLAAAAQRDKSHREINEKFDKERMNLRATYQEQLDARQSARQEEVSANAEAHTRSWSRVVGRWQSGMQEFTSAVDSIRAFAVRQFPVWDAVDWEEWTPPDYHLPTAQLGHFQVDLSLFEGGHSSFDELRLDRESFELPALTAFADHPLLLWEAWDEGRDVANRAMRQTMLRLFTSLPPGKIRFTILDPVGLGQNFSAFMHLADLDEKLINHRIWTEPGQIEKRLANLTEHMEDVIQTYLRNEFATIDEYNRHAGEVAEPFHVLVVSNFPAGFSDEAAARLLSVVNSGARCGVYTLISADSHLELPRNFQMSDLERRAVVLQWTGKHFRWSDDALQELPLELEMPPAEAVFTDVLRAYGARAKAASRVEVPFANVAPEDEQWWQASSQSGIEVPLGRAGATKLQALRLGHGTSQHVLISGKTGSGKSTLLHALITNTALRYSPEEVEFYLIDFKKGVEFKPYAEHRLPHARVIAIESEREFGMSVLERLDDELKRRGDLFREHRVQDVKGFRESAPAETLPRILLIIDEFQEFFVQDDKVAQDAALLLDRLVRQGRAFGIHVLLGSQTLAGAYSLARSTIGQMAVRIALQCSEADSHLILSEDNNAARLLSRPGEAIYNDANGLVEGNHPFQVVWLPTGEQETHLEKIAGLATQQESVRRSAVVFEGNAAANIADNVPLADALAEMSTAATASSTTPPRVWLGDAVAIKDPTHVVLQRQSGANLVIVGQQEEVALGVLSSAVVSLLATSTLDSEFESPQIQLLDGMRKDGPDAAYWKTFSAEFSTRLHRSAPDACAAPVQDLTRELRRRQEADSDAPSRFLVIYNLSRFRDLRRSDDDFGFSSLDEDESPSLSRQLTLLLHEGPIHGIHVVLWCDTYNNLTRWLDRQTIRDIDHRVLFQMSASDSSNLVDAPAASRLGVHRALLYSEEQGTMEKFRPYGTPDRSWIQGLPFASQPISESDRPA